MKAFTALALTSGLAYTGARTITLKAGADFEAECLKVVEPGDECYLEKGDYLHDGLTIVHGTADKRITITGDSEACIKGSNTQDRVLQIAHDYYTVKGICFDGKHSDEYVSTAIYVLGADTKSTKNGVTSSVTGLEMLDLEIRNFGSECVHFRYFVTHAEVYGCTFQSCGVEDFTGGGGGKVGEGIYLGTALDQVNDGKAPEPKIRSGGSDDIDVDECSHNLIHFNTFRTYGNECVDVKEGSHSNIIEENVCEMQQDENSGGFGLRGSDNIVRFNEISSCKGAAVRIGGDKGYGTGNHVYGNKINDMGYGAFNLMSSGHGEICDNAVSDATLAVGSKKNELDPTVATSTCASTPSDYDHFDFFETRGTTESTRSTEASPSENTDSTDDSTETTSNDSNDDSAAESSSNDDSTDSNDVKTNEVTPEDGSQPGVNGAAEPSPTEVQVIETNTIGVTNEDGECAALASAGKVEVEHSYYVDGTTDVENLFDGDHGTYFSIHRESTTITFELAEETSIEGVSIGFFIKGDEERIQTFDISVRDADATEWTTVISGEESDGSTSSQHFQFVSPQTALYVQFKSRGNTFNNWTALTEFHVCAASEGENNALFGGVRAFSKELQDLTGEVCATPQLLTPTKVTAHGGENNINALFDGIFETRWTTLETVDENDLQNGKITMHFYGDQRVSRVRMSFFDGDLARQHFSLYKQSAAETSWTPVLEHQMAERTENYQNFEIQETGVNKLYVVANGNDIGAYTKISELQAWGC